MKLNEYVVSGRGKATQLARAIGAHCSDISLWASGKRPTPIKYGAAIEAATAGAVTRKDLWPDDWQSIWPELQEEGA